MRSRFLPLLWIGLLAAGCAQQGNPTGGPRDEDPPVVIECDPPNYSTRFQSRRIAITFNEYVVLDNVRQELVASPPMKEKPEVRLRKRTVVVELQDTLKPNTTYTLNFGSAIKDLHEGNKLLNYEYVFSTGDELDSLSVRGTLLNAADLTVPKDPVTVMLYTDLRDSVPLLDIPLYVGRSNDSGVFQVNNLRADTFKVFALVDGNFNLLFDQPTEAVGFLDSALIVHPEFNRQILKSQGLLPLPEEQTDSLAILPETDSLSLDSLRLKPKGPDLNSVTIDLVLFTEKQEQQYLIAAKRDERWKLDAGFAAPLTDSFSYRFLPPEGAEPPRVLPWFSQDRDSLTLWLPDSTDYNRDTLVLELCYTMSDSGHFHTRCDTIPLVYRDRTKTGSGRGTRSGEVAVEAAKETAGLKIETIKNKGSQHLHRPLALKTELPLLSWNDTLIRLVAIPDSTEEVRPFALVRDSTVLNRLLLHSDWEGNMNYRLLLLPGALNALLPPGNDSLLVNFTTRETESYGQIIFNLAEVDGQVVIQLTSKDKVLRQVITQKSGSFRFEHLDPGDYTFRVIHDRNGNGVWDTGDYLEKRQPEDIEFLGKDITVRANWDHEESMTLKK